MDDGALIRFEVDGQPYDGRLSHCEICCSPVVSSIRLAANYQREVFPIPVDSSPTLNEKTGNYRCQICAKAFKEFPKVF